MELGWLIYIVDDERGCVVCDGPLPPCPVCSDGQTCALIPATCQQCPMTQCVAITDSNTTDSQGIYSSGLPSAAAGPAVDVGGPGGPSKGAIAGICVAVLVVLIVFGGLVWWMIRRRRALARQMYEKEEAAMMPYLDESSSAGGGGITARRSGAGRTSSRPESSHTLASLASTVLTRASNIIPIAYFPTSLRTRDNNNNNTDAPSTPDSEVPPVPQIPTEHSNNAYSLMTQFFSADELMRSSYSPAAAAAAAAATASDTIGEGATTPLLDRGSVASSASGRDSAAIISSGKRVIISKAEPTRAAVPSIIQLGQQQPTTTTTTTTIITTKPSISDTLVETESEHELSPTTAAPTTTSKRKLKARRPLTQMFIEQRPKSVLAPVTRGYEDRVEEDKGFKSIG